MIIWLINRLEGVYDKLSAYLRMIVAKEKEVYHLLKETLSEYSELSFKYECDVYWKDERCFLIECYIEAKVPLKRSNWEKIFEALAGNFLVSDDGDFLELAYYSYADDIYKQSDIFVTLNIEKRFIL